MAFGRMKLFVVLILANFLCDAAAFNIKVTSKRTLVRGQAILALEYSPSADDLTVFTDKEQLRVSSSGVVSRGRQLDSGELVTDAIEDPVSGRVEVIYSRSCLRYTAPDGAVKSFGGCSGVNNTKADISPYGISWPDRTTLVIIFTDEFSNSVMSWSIADDKVTSLLLKEDKLVRARGITCISTSTCYMTMSNGIYALKDRRVITGNSEEFESELKDGTLNEARFSHPTGITALGATLLAVADYSNNRVRIVDLTGNEVTSLCVDSALGGLDCHIDAPLSLAANKDLSKLYVGTGTSLLEYSLSPPDNFCYGQIKSGVSSIKIKGKSVDVWCDMDTPDGPWMTMLRRYDGSQYFNRSYADYGQGFGDVNGEHWLGLENIHLLTANKQAELRIDVEAFRPPLRRNSVNAYAHYGKFWIGDSASGYTLEEIAVYNGTAGDMESTSSRTNMGGPHKSQKFSTWDKEDPNGCAGPFNGGWWFRKCYTACLTCGPYSDPPNKRPISAAMIYYPFTLRKTGLKSASMKIKLPKSMMWSN